MVISLTLEALKRNLEEDPELRKSVNMYRHMLGAQKVFDVLPDAY